MVEPDQTRPLPVDAGRLLDAFREPVLQVAPDGRVVYANNASRSALGVIPGEFVGSFLDPSSRADLDLMLTAYTRDGAFPENDRRWTWNGPSGDPIRTVLEIANLWDAGQVIGFLATDRRDDGREANLHWQTLVDAAPGHILILDRDYRIVYLNREAGGEYKDRILGHSAFEFLLPESHEELRGYYARAAAGESVTYEVRGITLDGQLAWYLARVAPLPPICHPAVLILFATDISERRREEEFARAVIDYAPVGIRVFDPDGNEVRLNETMRQMLGEPHVAGEPTYNLMTDTRLQASGDIERFQRALTGEVVVDRPDFTSESLKMDGACPGVADRMFFPIPDGLGGVQAVVVFCVDMTEQRHIERKLREAQKLESLGVLAGGLAHDLNNLMTPIVGHAELALTAVPDDAREPVADHVRQVVRAAEQAANLCQQLLAYAGRGQFVVGPMNLSELVRRGEALLRHAAGPRVELRLHLATGLPGVRADSGQLRQVLLNLVANAAEAIGDRPGEVEVGTGVRRLEREDLALCRVGAERPEGDYVWLEVRDTGQGMAPEILARAFDPFFTTKFTGRGLGLAAVLGIVQGHGGALAVDSTPGFGTAFRLYLPAVAEEIPARPGTDVHAALPSWGGEVLLADDEDEIRVVVGAMLEGLGFQVDAVADGREAIEHVRSGKKYRLAILDVTMREVGGAQALADILRITPHLPVVLMSGYAADEVGKRIGDLGCQVPILQKPFRLADLAGMVHVILPNHG